MLPRAQSLLQQAEALEEQFSADGDLGGVQVRLAASSTIGNHLLPPLLAQWAQALPQVCAQVLVGNTADVAQALMRFEADLGFIDAQ
jgi:DNA-binding transcriptional LysR family regulator